MQRYHRLRDSNAFERVRRDGDEYRNRWLVLLVAPNDVRQTRFGFIVGRRRGTAVVRNKIKRRLREAARLRLADNQLKPGYDIVVIARAASVGVDFNTLDDALGELLGRADLIHEL